MKSKKSDSRMWAAYNDFHYYCDTARMQKVFARHKMFLETASVPGHIIDAGVFKGSSTLLFAHMLKVYCPYTRKKVIGFDTFGAKFNSARRFEKKRATKFMAAHQSGMEKRLRDIIDEHGLNGYCELVRGDIAKTLPAYIARNRGMRISLLHLDLDVYEPTLAVLRACFDLMAPGGLMLLDQYGVEGWGETEAVDAFFKERNLKPAIQSVEHTATPTAVIRI